MSGLSRRDLLRASAGAAALAVPITALSSASGSAGAAGTAGAAAHDAGAAPDVDLEPFLSAAASGPVMFCVHDAARGEVAVMHGADEVIVRDHQLVARILDAAARRAV